MNISQIEIDFGNFFCKSSILTFFFFKSKIKLSTGQGSSELPCPVFLFSKRKEVITMKKRHGFIAAAVAVSLLAAQTFAGAYYTQDLTFPLQSSDNETVTGDYYVKSTLDNISWGFLPNRDSEPILTVPSGSTVTFDTVSHEGILEDQGRDPVKYFGQYGVSSDMVLDDAKAIAASDDPHDFLADGPHVVTGPIAVEGAEPGDVLKVEVLDLAPRVPYGVITNRHFKGALPDEFPEKERLETASVENPEAYGDVSVFCPIHQEDGIWYGTVDDNGTEMKFPLSPFLGIMGVAPDTSEKVSTVPPINVGGNLDINELGVGATLYLPVEVEGAKFYTGDPHFVQGDGEVALTALEGSLRGTVRLTLLKAGDSSIPKTSEKFTQAFAETEKYWIPIGLNEDLDEAMKQSVRESVNFLSNQFNLDRAKVYAYLSAGVDYEVSQVVDKTKGIHALIPKVDFRDILTLKLNAGSKSIDVGISSNQFYVPLRETMEALGYTVEWDGATNSIVMTKDGKSVTAVVESNIYNADGQNIVLTSSSFISEDGVTMLPVSALSDAAGLSVNWTTSGSVVTGSVQ